eukprot:15897723-Heterocapsa_arctica.AAC.1
MNRSRVPSASRQPRASIFDALPPVAGRVVRGSIWAKRCIGHCLSARRPTLWSRPLGAQTTTILASSRARACYTALRCGWHRA